MREALLKLARRRSLIALGASFLATLSARLLTFVMVVIIARRLGPESYGTFTFATGIAVLAAQLGTLGWPLLATRFIPQFAHEGDWGRLRGLNFTANIVVLVSMVAIGLGLTGFALLFLDRQNPLFIGMLLAAVLIIPTGMRLLNRERLAAIGRAATGIFLDESIAPVLVIGACLAFATYPELHIYSAYVLGTYMSALLAWFLYHRWTFPEARAGARRIDFRYWMSVSLPMATAVASRVGLLRLDAVMVAPLSSVSQAGLFNAAFRVAFLATMLPAMIAPVMRPMLSGATAAGRHEHVAYIMRYYYAYTTLLAVVISGTAIVFAREIILILFGAEYIGAIDVLRILAVGTCLGSVGECTSSYLLMCGKERAFGMLSTLSFAAAVAINFMLVPSMGAKGAALGNVVANLLFLSVAPFIVARAIARRNTEE